MPSLWLPNAEAEAAIEEESCRREAHRAIEFTRDLKAIDARLDCFLCTRNDPVHDVKAGWYYIRRRNDDGTTTLWELSSPDGGFVEPCDQILQAFKHGDTATNPGYFDEVQAARERRERDAAQARRELAGEIAEELVGTIAPKTQIQVP